MTLLSLAFHRVGTGKYATSLDSLKKTLLYIKHTFSIVLPGDPLLKHAPPSLCLTFDDATVDFYVHVFPLLKEMGIRALLGVPVGYICEDTKLSLQERLKIPYSIAMQEGIYEEKCPFCTWKELEEMVKSGFVEIASHSYMHPNLTFRFVNLEKEIVTSKKILEERLPQSISSFIYPFGRCTKSLHHFVQTHYLYSFRLGSKVNHDWNAAKAPLSRIPADGKRGPHELLAWYHLLGYRLKAVF